MYRVVFHPDVIDDLDGSFDGEQIKAFIKKTEARLAAHPEPDGRVIKRLQHLITAIFFEYKVRLDWRAIFYIDQSHREVRVLGFVPKNLSTRLFDRELDTFFFHRFKSWQ